MTLNNFISYFILVMSTYLFFTGGYDSTYRLCELLLKEKKQVQPIYIMDPYLDNYTNNRTRRRNYSNEKKSQEKIIAKIKKMFPDCSKLLKDTIIVPKVPYDKEIELAMKDLKKRKYIRRSKCQYGAMAQYCKNNKVNVEVCAEKHGHFERKLRNKIDNNNMFNIKKHPELVIFKYFELPLFSKTKEDMLNEAQAYNFDELLRNTWSCWYPKKNKPCGKCIMCKERIVPYVEGFQTLTKQESRIFKKNEIYILIIILLLLIATQFITFA